MSAAARSAAYTVVGPPFDAHISRLKIDCRFRPCPAHVSVVDGQRTELDSANGNRCVAAHAVVNADLIHATDVLTLFHAHNSDFS